jgi:hypothetical protein
MGPYQPAGSIEDLLSGETITGTTIPSFAARNRHANPENSFKITVKPHSYRVFRLKDIK